jgi:hypothetical protein
LGVLIGCDLFVARNGGTKAHILKGSSQSIDDLHCEKDVFLLIEDAVVIVSQVVQELTGVGIYDGG